MDLPNNGIVLYHYSFSPYARRVIWYLQLRGIDYAECKQPPTLPRPDLKLLNISYRRIPVMAIGKDVYCDTRIMLQKLEERFPDGALGASQPDQKAVEKLLEAWSIQGGLFNRASQLIPPSMPLLNDPKFQKDREDFSGRSWSKDDITKMRPEAVAHIRNGFRFLENTLLADGRQWILNTKSPSLADIEAIWVFDWLNGLKGALPRELISEKQFPRVFAWIDRFDHSIREAKKNAAKPATLDGKAAAERILNTNAAEADVQVDVNDPLALRPGEEVDVWPTDSGASQRDRGELIGLTADEVVIKLKEGKGVRLHCPRTDFRIRPVTASSGKL